MLSNPARENHHRKVSIILARVPFGPIGPGTCWAHLAQLGLGPIWAHWPTSYRYTDSLQLYRHPTGTQASYRYTDTLQVYTSYRYTGNGHLYILYIHPISPVWSSRGPSLEGALLKMIPCKRSLKAGMSSILASIVSLSSWPHYNQSV